MCAPNLYSSSYRGILLSHRQGLTWRSRRTRKSSEQINLCARSVILEEEIVRSVLVFLLTFVLCPAYANELHIDRMRLSQARAKIQKLGWKPRETRLKFGDRFEKMWGNALVFYKAGFREVEICAGTGVNPCIFNYIRGKECLRVYTVGEQPRYTTVSTITHECPPNEAL